MPRLTHKIDSARALRGSRWVGHGLCFANKCCVSVSAGPTCRRPAMGGFRSLGLFGSKPFPKAHMIGNPLVASTMVFSLQCSLNEAGRTQAVAGTSFNPYNSQEDFGAPCMRPSRSSNVGSLSARKPKNYQAKPRSSKVPPRHLKSGLKLSDS